MVANNVRPKREFITISTHLSATSEVLYSQLLNFISDMLHHERKYLQKDGMRERGEGMCCLLFLRMCVWMRHSAYGIGTVAFLEQGGRFTWPWG